MELKDLNPAEIAALSKLAGKAASDSRPQLLSGTHSVDRTITLHITADVKVGNDHHAITPQKAQPWAIIQALLEESNKRLLAAGQVGINLEEVVVAAQKIDPELASKAKTAADSVVAGLKAPTKSFRKGSVKVTGSLDAETPETETYTKVSPKPKKNPKTKKAPFAFF